MRSLPGSLRQYGRKSLWEQVRSCGLERLQLELRLQPILKLMVNESSYNTGLIVSLIYLLVPSADNILDESIHLSITSVSVSIAIAPPDPILK